MIPGGTKLSELLEMIAIETLAVIGKKYRNIKINFTYDNANKRTFTT